MNLGSNLKALRKHYKITQADLAARVSSRLSQDIGQSVISRLEVTNAKSSEYAYDIAQALGVPTDALYDTKIANEIVNNRSHSGNSVRPENFVPVYLQSNNGSWCDGESIDHQWTPEKSYSKAAFWVEIDDNSCLPYYQQGTRFHIILKKPTPGDLVFASLPDKTHGIRSYKKPTTEGYNLEPINSSYATYDLNDPDRKCIIGTVELITTKPIKF